MNWWSVTLIKVSGLNLTNLSKIWIQDKLIQRASYAMAPALKWFSWGFGFISGWTLNFFLLAKLVWVFLSLSFISLNISSMGHQGSRAYTTLYWLFNILTVVHSFMNWTLLKNNAERLSPTLTDLHNASYSSCMIIDSGMSLFGCMG